MRGLRLMMAAVAVAWASASYGQSLTYAPLIDPLADIRASLPSGPFLRGTPVNPTTDYVNLSRITGPLDGPAGGFGYVSVGDLALALSPQQSGPSSLALVTIANRLQRTADRFREGIALAGAVNVLPPNAGDRFAVSVGGAGYDGTGAGSVAISMRITEDTLAYVGYARGPTQSLVKGGIGMSFR